MLFQRALPHRDHPRPCGEKAARLPSTTSQRGSPPPMRGKGGDFGARWSVTGITPAHAGKSARSRPPRRSARDHPRPCGEKVLIQSIRIHNTGSPPPMRGKVCDRRLGGSKNGITPAHAGKRRCVSGVSCDSTDHPRPCGEKCSLCLLVSFVQGSPPPMRGKVGFHKATRLRPGSPPPMRGKDGGERLLGEYTGITPAHAGKRCRPRRF